jgi:hypothetical protein
MKKTILEIYALAVCFAVVVCTTVTLGIALWQIVTIAQPEFTIGDYSYEQHQDNAHFPDYRSGRCASAAPLDDPAAAAAMTADEAAKAAADVADGTKTPASCKALSEAALTAVREASWARALAMERRDGTQGLAKCLLVLLVNLVVFLPHWMLARRARAEPVA